MRVLLLRHGMTKGNMERRYVGKTDEPLEDSWRDRLRAESAGVDAGTVAVVCTSPMRRCAETAGLLFPEVQYPDVLRITCRDLSECDFGAFEYKNYQELNGDPSYQRWIDGGGTGGFPGGESVCDFKRRSADAFKSVLLEHRERTGPDQTFVFVVHGGTIMAVMERFAIPSRDYFSWQVECGCGFCGDLLSENGGLSIVNVAKIRIL